ncbi:MAG: phage terminase large subunit family protein, partial [Selenomonadaceae bacterium]|nr:phage terminase large subunit family protein [Selenomonadaceae bacterium]
MEYRRKNGAPRPGKYHDNTADIGNRNGFSKSRLQKLISDTKVLTPLFYEKLKSRDANQTILSKVFKGGRIILVGANSPSGLASRPIRILLCDEVDRYPLSAGGGEGDPVSLAIVRCSTYWNYKVALFSTPTIKGQSRIDAAYEEGTQE